METTDDGVETCNSFKVPGVEEPLTVFVDPPHLLKSQRNMLVNHGEFKLHDFYVKEANLSYDKVHWDWIEKMVQFQSERQLRIAPHLSEKDIDVKGTYAKMKVNLAMHVFSHETATALKYCVQNYPEVFSSDALTTAWFCDQVAQYFAIVSCRGNKLALSLQKPEEYEKAIKFLKWFMGLYTTTEIAPDQKGGLKPTQRGIIMSTTSYVWLADYMLRQPGIKFFKCGMVSNDPIENFHSCVRARNPKPTCLAFKRILRAICMCQCLEGSDYGSYQKDDSTNYLTDLKAFKEAQQRMEEERVAAMDEDNIKAEGDEFQEAFEDAEFAEAIAADLVVEEDDAEINALAYLAGYLLHKTIMTRSKCKTCQEAFVGDENDEQAANELIRLRDYRVGALCRPTELANKMVQWAENVFRGEQEKLMKQKQSRIGDKITSILKIHWEKHYPEAPKCHLKILAGRFAKLRLHFYGVHMTRKLVVKQKNKLTKESRASRSTAVMYAENMK